MEDPAPSFVAIAQCGGWQLVDPSAYPMNRPVKRGFAAFMKRLVHQERGFFRTCFAYGTAVSLLSLAVPVAVQMVINTVANTAQQLSLLIVCSMVVGMLIMASILYALQVYTMELFRRRFFARNVAEYTVLLTDLMPSAPTRLDGHEMVKRFYEIMSVQSVVPNLIISSFALGLQTIMGLVLVAFYHPFMLGFNILFIAACLVVWRLWHRQALESARTLAEVKYAAAGWFGNLADQTMPLAASAHAGIWQQCNQLSYDYIAARRSFFGHTFAQTIGFLLIYIFSSAGLLGLGGWLVIEGQLTLGQLAAAELVLSAIFIGVTRVGHFLKSYYELCIAAEKIDALHSNPLQVLAEKVA